MPYNLICHNWSFIDNITRKFLNRNLDFDEFSVDRAAAAVSKLDDSQREILFLRYCCELPVQDIAELFRVTQPEMSAKIRYALAALRYAINNDGGSDK